MVSITGPRRGAFCLLVRCEFWSMTFPPRQKQQARYRNNALVLTPNWFCDWELRYRHVLRRYRDSSRLQTHSCVMLTTQLAGVSIPQTCALAQAAGTRRRSYQELMEAGEHFRAC